MPAANVKTSLSEGDDIEALQRRTATMALLAKCPDETLLPTRTVLDVLDVSQTSLYRLISEGVMPKPVRLAGKNQWSWGTLRRLITEREAAAVGARI